MPDLLQPTGERESQQDDDFRRLDRMIDLLDERAMVMLDGIDPQALKPMEHVRATVRLMDLLLRLMQFRWKMQQTTQTGPSSADYQALVDALLHGSEHP